MKYTIWRREVLIGHTDLAMSSPGPSFRAGHLTPTADFERAWPELGRVIGEVVAAGMAVGSAVADLPPPAADADPAERGRRIYERLSAHPGAARLRAASEALASLGLEVRDPAGRLVSAKTVMIQEVRPPAWVSAADIARELEQARKESLEIQVPSYIIVVWDVTESPDAA